MPLVVDQIVYSSFPQIGYQVFASPEISTQIKTTFVEQVVYAHWDVYEPPPAGYRAGFIHQISLAQTFFGWLFNDGADDYGRLHTPYCLGYYLKRTLGSESVDLILQCLQAGPLDLISRQIIPTQIKRLTITQANQRTAEGVVITATQQQQIQQQVKQQQLLQHLFIHPDSPSPVVETEAQAAGTQALKAQETVGIIPIVPEVVIPDLAADSCYPLGQERLPAIPMNFGAGPHISPQGDTHLAGNESPEKLEELPLTQQARQLVGAVSSRSVQERPKHPAQPEDLASQIVSILDELL
jgi:hypothetical protein